MSKSYVQNLYTDCTIQNCEVGRVTLRYGLPDASNYQRLTEALQRSAHVYAATGKGILQVALGNSAAGDGKSRFDVTFTSLGTPLTSARIKEFSYFLAGEGCLPATTRQLLENQANQLPKPSGARTP